MNIKKILIIMVSLGLVFASIGCENNDSGDKKQTIEKANKDAIEEKNITKYAEENGYEVYKNSTDEQKYAFSKNDGKKIETKYSNKKEFEYQYRYIKDYTDNKNEVNFILIRTYSDKKYIFSMYSDDKNNVLIENYIFKNCAVDKCVTSGKSETTIENYEYNVKDNKLIAIDVGQETLKLKDIEIEL
ncbi:MAG: hypothetical protein ACK5NF_05255 [Bacilli bacterium]